MAAIGDDCESRLKQKDRLFRLGTIAQVSFMFMLGEEEAIATGVCENWQRTDTLPARRGHAMVLRHREVFRQVQPLEDTQWEAVMDDRRSERGTHCTSTKPSVGFWDRMAWLF